jgi:hypothetical protein
MKMENDTSNWGYKKRVLEMIVKKKFKSKYVLCPSPCHIHPTLALICWMLYRLQKMKRKKKDMYEVEVTLQLTVSQSVCQGIEPTLRLVTRYYFLSEGCFLKAAVLSLTRGRACHLSFSVCSNWSVFTSSIYVTCVLQFNNLYTICIKLHSVSPQYSRLCSTSSRWERFPSTQL